MDITFYDSLRFQNRRYIGILTIIEITTKYAYAYPIKNKTTQSIRNAFKQFIEEAREKPEVITTDEEPSFKTILKSYPNIKHFTTDGNKRKTAIIERFNRTLRDMITKYMEANKTKKWIDVLSELLENYNNRVHSSIKMAPKDMTKEDADRIRFKLSEINSQRRKANKVKVGDDVRILRDRSAFDKGTERYTKGIYEIVEEYPNSYILKSPDGKIQKRRFTRSDIRPIKKVEQSSFKPTEIHDEDKIKKRLSIIKKNRDSGLNINEDGDIKINKRLKPLHKKRKSKSTKNKEEFYYTWMVMFFLDSHNYVFRINLHVSSV